MPALQMPIPAGHCLHWKVRPDGTTEVELMLFLTLHNARWLAVQEAARGAAQSSSQ
jgi:hypothetical protein